MQRKDSDDFIKRSQYYTSRVYSSQLHESEDYNLLKRVFFIGILDYVLFPEHEDYRSDFILYDKKHKSERMNGMHWVFIELPKFEKKFAKDLNGYEEFWCFFFNEITNTAEIKKIVNNGSVAITRAWSEVQASSWTRSERLEYDVEVMHRWNFENCIKKSLKDGLKEGIEKGMQKGIKKGIQQGIKQGIEKGMQKGIQQGIEKGIQQGIVESKREIVKTMLRNNIAIEVIMTCTGLSKKEIDQLQEIDKD